MLRSQKPSVKPQRKRKVTKITTTTARSQITTALIVEPWVVSCAQLKILAADARLRNALLRSQNVTIKVAKAPMVSLFAFLRRAAFTANTVPCRKMYRGWDKRLRLRRILPLR